MKLLDLFRKTNVEQKALTPESISGVTGGERKDTDIFKAYIPNFLYKPPFGMPRRDNPVQYKKLSANPYIFSVIKTMCDEATCTDWEIRVKEEFQDDGNDYSDKIKEITRFLKNPNKNEQSFQHILRQLITDILEVDSGVLVKVFNMEGKMTQIFARDGSLFLKNPDIYGYMGNRKDFVLPLPEGFDGVAIDLGGTPTVSQQQIMKTYSLLYKEDAAYFQYGWTAGSMPVPFGLREIVYMMQMPRADSIYGTSPISRLQEIILNLIYGVDFNLDFYTNNNMPEGVIQLLGAKQEQIKQFRENFENQFKYTDGLGNKRKRFFKFPISSSEAKFTPFQLTAKEMDVIVQQEWFTKVMWMCFGVTAEEMGFTENSNKAVSKEQTQLAARKAVKPLLNVIEYHFNTQLINEFFVKGVETPLSYDIPLEFVFDNYDIQEDLKKHALIEQQIRMGVKTPEMAALELGINVDELKKSQEETAEKEMEAFEKQAAINGQNTGIPGKDEKKENPLPHKKEKVEKKAELGKDPFKEIDSYIDNVGQDISKLVGNLTKDGIEKETRA